MTHDQEMLLVHSLFLAMDIMDNFSGVISPIFFIFWGVKAVRLLFKNSMCTCAYTAIENAPNSYR